MLPLLYHELCRSHLHVFCSRACDQTRAVVIRFTVINGVRICVLSVALLAPARGEAERRVSTYPVHACAERGSLILIHFRGAQALVSLCCARGTLCAPSPSARDGPCGYHRRGGCCRGFAPSGREYSPAQLVSETGPRFLSCNPRKFRGDRSSSLGLAA